MEVVENEDQESRMMEECEDSSDDEDYPLLGEWRDKGFGNPVIQDIRSNEYEYREVVIRQLHEGSRGQPPLWPDVVSRWCIRHMGAKFF